MFAWLTTSRMRWRDSQCFAKALLSRALAPSALRSFQARLYPPATRLRRLEQGALRSVLVNVFKTASGVFYAAVYSGYTFWNGHRYEELKGEAVCRFVRSGKGSYSSQFAGVGYLLFNENVTVNFGGGAAYKSKIGGRSYSSQKVCESDSSTTPILDKAHPSISPFLEAYIGFSI